MASQMEKVKVIFDSWDADGGGTIEREELQEVMQKLSPQWGPTQINKLMAVIDKNGDGHITFTEFFNWLTDPTADQTLHEDGWFGDFDFAKHLLPLFQAFDRDSSGAISNDEFKECYAMLNSSLAIHPHAADAFVTIKDDSIFKGVDQNGDGEVDFEEFVHWQTEVIKKSRIPNGMLPEVLEELASALDEILHIDELCQQGHEVSGATEALENKIKQVAAATRQIYLDSEAVEQTVQKEVEAEQESTQVVQKTFWRNPPPDETSMNALLRKCAAVFGIRTGGAAATRKRAALAARRQHAPSEGVLQAQMCFPACTDGSDWIVKMTRGPPGDYCESFLLKGSALAWEKLEDESEFTTALSEFPQAVCIFSVLVAAARGQTTMSYEEGISALKTAVQLGYLRQHAVKRAADEVRRIVQKNLDEDYLAEVMADGALEDVIDEQLSSIKLRPIDLLQLLEATGLEVDKAIMAQLSQ